MPQFYHFTQISITTDPNISDLIFWSVFRKIGLENTTIFFPFLGPKWQTRHNSFNLETFHVPQNTNSTLNSSQCLPKPWFWVKDKIICIINCTHPSATAFCTHINGQCTLKLTYYWDKNPGWQRITLFN